MKLTVDVSGARALAVDMRAASIRAHSALPAVLSKAGLNIKTQQVGEAGRSKWFRQVSRSISYDIHAVTGGLELVVGPDKARAEGGKLANIGYFGSSRRPGGATLPDPVDALEVEAPKFEKALTQIVEGLL